MVNLSKFSDRRNTQFALSLYHYTITVNADTKTNNKCLVVDMKYCSPNKHSPNATAVDC